MSDSSTAAGPIILVPSSFTPSLSSEETRPVPASRTTKQFHRGLFGPAARSAALSVFFVTAEPLAEAVATPWGRRHPQTAVSQIAVAGAEHVLSGSMDVEDIWAVNPQRPTLWLVGYTVPLLPRRKPYVVLSNDEDE